MVRKNTRETFTKKLAMPSTTIAILLSATRRKTKQMFISIIIHFHWMEVQPVENFVLFFLFDLFDTTFGKKLLPPHINKQTVDLLLLLSLMLMLLIVFTATFVSSTSAKNQQNCNSDFMKMWIICPSFLRRKNNSDFMKMWIICPSFL